jgi:hypothetical protein
VQGQVGSENTAKLHAPVWVAPSAPRYPFHIDHAAKLNDASIADALHHPPVMHGDCRVNQITKESAQPRQCPVLVGASEPAVSNNVCGQDCCEFPSFDQGTPRADGICRTASCRFEPNAGVKYRSTPFVVSVLKAGRALFGGR